MNSYPGQGPQAVGGAPYPSPPKEVGQLETVNADLTDSLSNLHEVLTRMRQLADRIVGQLPPEPVNGTDNKSNAQAPSAVMALEITAVNIRNTSADLSTLLNRLERL